MNKGTRKTKETITQKPKLIEYIYDGKKNQKKIKSSINALNLASAKVELRKQGIVIQRIRKKPQPLFQFKQKITNSEICIFFRQLATMMKAGVALVQSFEIIGNGSNNPSMREMLLEIKENIETGTSLSESLKKYPVQFDELSRNLIQAGENSGTLDTMLSRIATYKEKTESLKAKVKKALIYPASVLAVAVVVTIVLLVWVVPQFEQLFANFGAELPIFTQIVINLSRNLQDHGFLLLFAIGLFIAIFRFAQQKSASLNQILDRLVLKLPVIGQIIEKSIWARYSRTLSTTFAAGVPLLESLDSVAGAVGNSLYSTAVHQMINELCTGQQLATAMRNVELFPHMMLQMVAIGEESGSLDGMLSKIADFYEEEVDNMVDTLSSLLEPVIIVILGILVGGLIVAMYLPIFKMGGAVG